MNIKTTIKNKHRISKGFTLVELLVVLVICAVLTVIGVSSYNSFISDARARGAEADLMTLSVAMGNYYQQQLSYPSQTTSTTQTEQALPSWNPGQLDSFNYYIFQSTSSSYVLQAVGIAGTQMAGFQLELDSANNKTIVSPKNQGGATW